MQEQLTKDLELLSFQSTQESEDKLRVEKQLAVESLRIDELNKQLKFAMGQLASIKEKILLENRIFTEELDGLKDERHQSATKQVHI